MYTALSTSICYYVVELFLDFSFQFHITQTLIKEVFAQLLLITENL
jgi:hypothetical protein